MVWWWSKTKHDASIRPWIRSWLGSSILDRWLQVTVAGFLWFLLWSWLGLATGSAAGFFVLALIATLPWGFWILDYVVDYYHVQGELARLLATDGVILATRCEYIGGHPQLPHGRYAYLLLEGTRENPSLTLGFPAAPGQEPNYFQMPVLDVSKTKDESSPKSSIAGEMLASIQEKAGGLLHSDQVTLKIDYQGVGRTYTIQVTNFLHGGGEVRNWRNYLICAQAEADTGKTPFGPWKSLKPGFPTVGTEEDRGDDSRNGHSEPNRRSAFARR